MPEAERFTIKHRDEFERTGGWALARRSLGLQSFGMNVVDIETKGDTLKNALANMALDSSAGAGPILLIAGGLAIAIGALLD